jgi:hypothetical protein
VNTGLVRRPTGLGASNRLPVGAGGALPAPPRVPTPDEASASTRRSAPVPGAPAGAADLVSRVVPSAARGVPLPRTSDQPQHASRPAPVPGGLRAVSHRTLPVPAAARLPANLGVLGQPPPAVPQRRPSSGGDAPRMPFSRPPPGLPGRQASFVGVAGSADLLSRGAHRPPPQARSAPRAPSEAWSEDPDKRGRRPPPPAP